MSHVRGAYAQTGYRPLVKGTGRIWDANRTYTHKFYGFAETAWLDRAQWTQVPYDATAYTFKGDVILEGENFWIFLSSFPMGRRRGWIS